MSEHIFEQKQTQIEQIFPNQKSFFAFLFSEISLISLYKKNEKKEIFYGTFNL